MNIDFSKISKIYGENIVTELKDRIDDVVDNISYLERLGFTDIENIAERHITIFLCDTTTFKNKINNLINKLGPEYIEKIETNLDILGEYND